MRPRTPAGERRHRVLFQTPETAPDRFNAPKPTGKTTPVCTRWCKIETLTGRELWLARQVRADVTHRLTLLYTAGLVPKMEAVYQGRVFEILEVHDPEETRVELQVLCKERVQ